MNHLAARMVIYTYHFKQAMKKSLFIPGLAALLTSCSPIYYAPNTQNVPLLSEKNEISASVAGGDERVEVQGAYAAGNHLGIMVNGGLFLPRRQEDNADDGDGRFLEAGAGYFTPLGSGFIFEAYGLFGLGNVRNDFPSTLDDHPGTTGKIRADMFRYALQPGIGYKHRFFDVVLSSRFSVLNYTSVSGSLIFQGEDQVDYLRRNSSNFLIEPALTIRGGYEFIKLQLQIGQSLNLSNSDFRQEHGYATIGLVFNWR